MALLIASLGSSFKWQIARRATIAHLDVLLSLSLSLSADLAHLDVLKQVVGAFLEGGSADEAAALKKLAATAPALPGSEADLALLGLEFAAKLWRSPATS